MVITKEDSSFRDTSGEVIIEDGVYLRRVNPSYYDDYKHFIKSGLYAELDNRRLLIPHTEKQDGEDFILVPEQVKFISYPYEWCFSMLKEAALNTLEINCIALDYGMMLKDASAFNMQYHKGKMTLIDTLSFAKYDGGQPWVAYRQFIEHFLVPLTLMKYRDTSLSKLSEVFIDGIPVELAVKLLPMRLRLKPSLLAHIYAQGIKINNFGFPKEVKIPRRNLDALLDNLRGLVHSLVYKPGSAWSAYDSCSYTPKAFKDKHRIVEVMLGNIPVSSDNTLCDIGANTGVFSNLAVEKGYKVAAIDNDHDCIEYMHDVVKGLGLVADICNPTPAIGWGSVERKGFLDRLDVDTIMTLALIHHICIGNNTPLSKVAELFAGHCKHLIIEFVPPDDPKAKILAGNKTFPPYSQEIFEAEFEKYFNTIAQKGVEDSCRSIYLMFTK